MEFKHDKVRDDAVAVLVENCLRIKGEGGGVIAMTPRSVWLSDQTSFDGGCKEPDAVMFYPGDSITITF